MPVAREAHISLPLCDRSQWMRHGDERQGLNLYPNRWSFDFYGETLFTNKIYINTEECHLHTRIYTKNIC